MSNGEIDPRTVLTIRALTVSVDPQTPDARVLLSAATIIRQGGVVACPTETFYGFSVDPFNEKAVADLQELKRRRAPRALILLIPHTGAAFDVGTLKGVARRWFDRLTRAFWPGPLTLVLPMKARLDCPALAGGDTVGVRVSSHPVAHRLVQTTGRPVTSTSANVTGGEAVSTAAAIPAAIAHRLDLILDAGPTAGAPASTVLDLSRSRPTLLRAGAIGADRIAEVLGFAPRSLTAA